MVNGNYSVYGDRPSSETEYVDDHIRSSITVTADCKSKRTNNRSASELQNCLNIKQLDNETDSIKFEKKIKEPRLLRYVPTTDVEENFVAEKFETYYIKDAEEKPRRHPYTKKARNPTDGSVNYGYSRSSSSSPNLPTISEHSEQYSTYRIRPNSDEKSSYENKFDKYFMKTIEKYDGAQPGSLHRVGGAAAGRGRAERALRAMRWPAALIVLCAALGLFVYFLMPSNTEDLYDNVNSTVWEKGVSNEFSLAQQQRPRAVSSTTMRESTIRPTITPRITTTSTTTSRQGAEDTTVQDTTRTQNTEDTTAVEDRTTKKPIEIDFYHPEINSDVLSIIDSVSGDQKLLVPPIYPDHITPEVQYGDKDKGRTPKQYDEKNKLEDSTLKLHITQKPEKPLAILFKNTLPTTPESLNLSESGIASDLKFIEKLLESSTEEVHKQLTLEDLLEPVHVTKQSEANFTSGHSKIFGVGIEEVDKMWSTTQSSAYKTRVSPTLPTWRNTPDSATKNYPVNNTDVSHCHSTQVRYCRGALPYDLAGPPINLKGLPFTALLRDMTMFYNQNCSSRLRQFVCSLLEPECQPLGTPPKRPCQNMCKIVRGYCEHIFPMFLQHFLNCEEDYPETDCVEMLQPCYEDEVPCRDGTCVHKHMVCNGFADCPNGADEEGCEGCVATQYRCPSTGECIFMLWLCDGVSDCTNGEDESLEECRHFWDAGRDAAGQKGGTELGGQGAGSSPARAITAYRHPTSRKHKTDESSKELLETSDTSNALKRNYTRRVNPGLSRLKPLQNRPVLERTLPPIPLIPLDEINQETSSETRQKSPRPDDQREDKENVGLLDSYENKNQLEKQTRPKVQKVFRSQNKENKTSNYFERHIDANKMVEAQMKEEKAERAKKMRTPPEEMLVEQEEAGAAGRSSPCPSGELRCVDGRCITLAMLCDGQNDCSDRADEENCFT